jgi:menaquinone-9 beta-reductase
MIYDVAIAGGGISGLALSIDLKRRGYNVVVLEKGNYPRHKVCGEYVSLESVDYLNKICPALRNLQLPLITNFRMTAPGNSIFDTALTQGGIGISRYLLEHLLYEEAKRNGVNVIVNRKVNKPAFSKYEDLYILKHHGEEVKAKLFCNASGKNSNLFKGTAQVSKYIAVKYHVKLDRDKEKIEIHNFPGGYCGISDIEDGKSCLCYIVNTDKLQESGNSIEKMQERFLFKNASLKNIFSRSHFLFEKPLVISGIDFRIKETAVNNNFYIGDAAGTVAPVTGNGMSMGLRSAAFLANEIDLYFKGKINKSTLNINYSNYWKTQFAAKVKLSNTLQTLSESTTLTRLSITLFNIFPSLAQTLIKQTHGKPF